MILLNWDRQWQSVKFDEVTGAVRTQWLRRAPTQTQGFAMKRGRQWYAVRLDGSEIVFQTGGRAWCLAGSELECGVAVEKTGTRRFSLRENGESVLEVSYPDPSTSFFARRDPTRDALDEELEDMFLWLRTLSRSAGMQNDLAKVWRGDR